MDEEGSKDTNWVTVECQAENHGGLDKENGNEVEQDGQV